MFSDFLVTFVPLFIAIDAIGTVPMVLAVTQDFSRAARRRAINVALVTALLVGLGFLFLGQWALDLMGIKVSHFAIGGGIILLILAARDVTTGKMMDVPIKEELVAVVPIGTPLTVGPATITTLLFLAHQHSLGVVLLAFALNVLIAWIAFMQCNTVVRVLGLGGVKAVSKVASLLLAAVAISLIFRGLPEVWPR